MTENEKNEWEAPTMTEKEPDDGPENPECYHCGKEIVMEEGVVFYWLEFAKARAHKDPEGLEVLGTKELLSFCEECGGSDAVGHLLLDHVPHALLDEDMTDLNDAREPEHNVVRVVEDPGDECPYCLGTGAMDTGSCIPCGGTGTISEDEDAR